MPAAFTLNGASAALLVMDYQNDMLSSLGEKQEAFLERAVSILNAAREAHLTIIYVVVRFRDGYPEISPRNRSFAALREAGRLREGAPGAEIHARVFPLPGESVVTKRRVGAFSTTDLETILRAQGVRRLILMGIATSGVVLSTVRWAADMDYELVVVEDCCADRDEEVHRVLTQKIFPRQASVVSAQEVVEGLK
ncbi:MAG: cysteine hydrolase [Ktedonobacteraceae bacterium]|nr:cysteine hydrolase [Ktedonobacteraceae bacterium]